MLRRSQISILCVSLAGAVALLGAPACSSGKGTSTGNSTSTASTSTGTGASNGGGSAGTGSTSAGSSATGSSSTGDGGSTSEGGEGSGTSSAGGSSEDDGPDPFTPLEEDEICDTIELSADFLPVDMLIMLDRSASMTQMGPSGETRWESVTAGLESFLGEDDLGDMRVAFDFFDNDEDLVDGLDGTYQCEGENYSTPEVALGALDEAGPEILEAIGPTPMGAFTPLYPALEGALQWAIGNAEDEPERATVVLLATDGLPYSQEQCIDSIREIALLAEEAFESDHKIRTFVIGVGVGLANISTIAERGGGQGFLIEDENVEQRFSEAMRTVVNQPPSCDIDLPVRDAESGEVLDASRAQVVVTDLYDGEVTAVPRVSRPSDCIASVDVEGFYFDSNDAPTTVTLCPASCNRLGRGEARLDLACRPFASIQ